MYGFDSTGSYRWLDRRPSLVELFRLWARLPLPELQRLYGAIMAYRFYAPPTRHQKPGKHFHTKGSGRAHKAKIRKLTIARGLGSIGEYDRAVSLWLEMGRVGSKPSRFYERKEFAA
jgi:pentatricopeptide repeat protein